jgi:hypothetical protein
LINAGTLAAMSRANVNLKNDEIWRIKECDVGLMIQEEAGEVLFKRCGVFGLVVVCSAR